ncbi:hypothetical protein [Azospirillum doebereinerae]|uniref:hypothetical protein n=1 Tax=Azospirillum doebereinerae TaxID=92933 RepID=UPI00163B64C5|nr:hypothetical protein [Azospirillum doebereinerae]
MDTMGDNGQVMPTLSLADIDTTKNGEPRILDLRLAEVLGFAQVRDIRKLIERHREVLERLGEVCATVAQTSRKGGRPATEFWLTKKQAVYLCTKAETERAITVTIQIVELFDAVTGSGAHPALAPVLTRADLDAIDRQARRIGLEEEGRARAALTGQALDRLRRGERIDIDTLTAGRPSAPAALPPPPSHAREERIDRAVALLRALPPELRQEGFRLMHAIKSHSEALKE